MGERVYTEQVAVQGPVEVVWEVLADVAQWPSWTESVTAASVLDAAPLRPGSQVRIKQPQMPAMTWTVERLVPQRGFAWTSRSTGVTTVADHQIEPAPHGSTVSLEVRQSGPLAGLAHALFGKRTQRYLRMEAAGLKARTESRVAASPGADG